jgi:hypothetical protein
VAGLAQDFALADPVHSDVGLGDHPKAAIDYHFKTGHREKV